jgi:hypothetical protein
MFVYSLCSKIVCAKDKAESLKITFFFKQRNLLAIPAKRESTTFLQQTVKKSHF